MLTGDRGYERRLDMMLRLGPYGDGFGARPGGLTLQRLLAEPHGVDLGPLRPRLPGCCARPAARWSSRRRAWSPRPPGCDRIDCGATELVLIGRRHLRSTTQLDAQRAALAAAPAGAHCMHPDDARRLGIDDDTSTAVVKGAGGGSSCPSRSPTPSGRGGCPCRGWGHGRDGTRAVAAAQPGANVNQLNDGRLLDPLSGHRGAQQVAGDGVRRGLGGPQTSSHTAVTWKLTVC
jgi:hypothetical protein